MTTETTATPRDIRALPLGSSGLGAGQTTPVRAAFEGLVYFVGLTFAWSWGCWLLAPLVRGQAGGVASGLLVLGSFGPTLADRKSVV